MNYEPAVNDLLRAQLIDLSLLSKNEELYNLMFSDNWENHLVCPEKNSDYKYVEKVDGSINELLRNQLIDLSLVTKNKELFILMTSYNWEEHLVCPIKSQEYTYIEKEDSIEPFNYEKFFSENKEKGISPEEYIENTTITDRYEDKKTTLHQLLMLSKSLNKNIYQFMHKIYNDKELLHLLTFTSEKTYRNAVFYLDDESEEIKVKDARLNVASLSIMEALEFYREQNQAFFIEIKMVESI